MHALLARFKISEMKSLNEILKGASEVVFLDFEGTQFSQEIIAIGAIKATIDSKYQIKRKYPSFKIYVKSNGEVGKIVTKLTGIDDALLKNKGVGFFEALDKLKKYVGKNYKKMKYLTYGNFDMRLLHQTSIDNSLDDEFIQSVYKNHVDYANFLSRYVRSNKNDQISLLDGLKTFEVTPYGNPHDPEADAVNLMYLYEAVIKKRTILKEEYKKVLFNNTKLPRSMRIMLKKIRNGEKINRDTLDSLIEEDL